MEGFNASSETWSEDKIQQRPNATFSNQIFHVGWGGCLFTTKKRDRHLVKTLGCDYCLQAADSIHSSGKKCTALLPCPLSAQQQPSLFIKYPSGQPRSLWCSLARGVHAGLSRIKLTKLSPLFLLCMSPVAPVDLRIGTVSTNLFSGRVSPVSFFVCFNCFTFIFLIWGVCVWLANHINGSVHPHCVDLNTTISPLSPPIALVNDTCSAMSVSPRVAQGDPEEWALGTPDSAVSARSLTGLPRSPGSNGYPSHL